MKLTTVQNITVWRGKTAITIPAGTTGQMLYAATCPRTGREIGVWATLDDYGRVFLWRAVKRSSNGAIKARQNEYKFIHNAKADAA